MLDIVKNRELILNKLSAFTSPSGDCLFWTGAMAGGKQPCLTLEGKAVIPEGKYSVGVIRLTYELHHGRIPAGLYVVMTCGNRRCVRHEHMALKTKTEILGRPLVDRFWEYVSKGDGCWEWASNRTAQGYGRIWDADNHATMAHRVSWEIAYGPIPEGISVLHRCDNPPCVRPDHLFLGTRSDNMRDMYSKGRWPYRPERAHKAKLDWDAVAEIRHALSVGQSVEAIASTWNVSVSAVRHIQQNRTWRAA